MRAVIWDKPGDLRIADVPDPTPGRGELVIRVGVCDDGANRGLGGAVGLGDR